MSHSANPVLPPQHLPSSLPLLGHANLSQPVAWRGGQAITVDAFLADVRHTAAALPGRSALLNLCADRYAFLVAFCAAASRGQHSLLPPSRARAVIDGLLHGHAGSYAAGDEALAQPPQGYLRLPPCRGAATSREIPRIDADMLVAIGFTSGSTGRPQAHPKTWRCLWQAGVNNAALLVRTMGMAPGDIGHVVATVASQHMYGMELSVMLPLLGPFAVHAGHPLLAADVAAALEQVPEPRLLVTTPVHLRTLLHAGIRLPPLAAVASATAPLSAELASACEQFMQAPLVELFGSTETCVIAHRRPAQESRWQLLDGIHLQPQPDGTAVRAAHLPADVILQDVVELEGTRHFHVRGRNADMIDIAGKRASLADLTQRLLSIPGVVDAVVLQTPPARSGSVQRIVAFAVAPQLTRRQVLDSLRRLVDPVFLPRPLHLVDALPRNENGKLPHARLMALLQDD